MSGVTFKWNVSPDVLARNVESYGQRLLKAVQALGQVFAQKIASYAKANAPWTDRTGNARQGLTGLCVASATGIVIYLFHSMSYGIWLEVKNAGRFAIILKSLEANYGPLMAAIRGLIGG